jgi:hypothetical protein
MLELVDNSERTLRLIELLSGPRGSED